MNELFFDDVFSMQRGKQNSDFGCDELENCVCDFDWCGNEVESGGKLMISIRFCRLVFGTCNYEIIFGRFCENIWCLVFGTCEIFLSINFHPSISKPFESINLKQLTISRKSRPNQLIVPLLIQLHIVKPRECWF